MASSVGMTGSIYGSIVAQNKGIGGLASGLDTESIMEALTSGTRSKIAKNQQNKQIAQWKQTAYRSVVTGMDEFRQKYLRFSGGGLSITSNTFFNTYKATTSSSKVKVTTTANSSLGDIKIDKVLQLATPHTIQDAKKFDLKLESEDPMADLYTQNYTDKTLKLSVGGDDKTKGAYKTIKLDTLNGKTGNITVDPVNNPDNRSDFELELQRLIDEAYGTKIKDPAVAPDAPGNQTSLIGVDTSSGKLELIHTAGQITVLEECEVLGLNKDESNRIDKSNKLGDIPGLKDLLMGDTFRFTIRVGENNEATTFSFKATDSLETVMTKINASPANVRMTYSIVDGKFEITSKVPGYTNKIVMKDTQGNLMSSIFGGHGAGNITSGALYTNDTISAVNISDFAADYTNDVINGDSKKIEAFITRLNEMRFGLTIGKDSLVVGFDMSDEFNASIRNKEALTDTDLLEALNRSIEKNFGEDYKDFFILDGTGKFQIDTKFTDGSQAIELESPKADEYDALKYLGFDKKEYTNVVDLTNQKEVASGSTYAARSNFAEGDLYKFDITVDGQKSTIEYELTEDDIESLNKLTDDIDKGYYLSQQINKAIYEEFGSAVSATSGSNVIMKVAFDIDEDGKFNLISENGLCVVVESSAAPGEFDVLSEFGFSGTRIDNFPDKLNTYNLGQLGVTQTGVLSFEVNGATKTVNYGPGTNLSTLVSSIENEGGTVYFRDGRLVLDTGEFIDISDNQSGAGSLLTELFSFDDAYSSFDANYDANGYKEEGGTNAQILMNGQVVSNSTNTFTISGTQVEVLEVSEATDKEIRIGMSSDPDELIERLRTFVDDYNGLISIFTTLTKEKKNKDYFPLGDEQKSELSTDEIEKWENEAKKGILYNDPTLNSVMNSLRDFLYDSVGDSGISLYSIGITTISVLSKPEKNGHLEITPENEDKLRNAIISNPDAVRELFTHATEGIAKKLDNAIDRAINTSSDPEKRGTLIEIAGTESGTTGNNTSSLDDKIKAYDDAIARLKTQLEREYKRYWNQFSALEVAIQNMSSQSSWLTDFVAS